MRRASASRPLPGRGCPVAYDDGRPRRETERPSTLWQLCALSARRPKHESSWLWPMGSLYELAMLVLFEIIVLELLRRTGKSFGAARNRHTNLE